MLSENSFCYQTSFIYFLLREKQFQTGSYFNILQPASCFPQANYYVSSDESVSCCLLITEKNKFVDRATVDVPLVKLGKSLKSGNSPKLRRGGIETERQAKGNGHGGCGAGAISEAEEGVGISHRLSGSAGLPQHPFYLLHRKHPTRSP